MRKGDWHERKYDHKFAHKFAMKRSDYPLHKDVIGGLTTFFTMAYIVIVNPAILSTAGTGLPFNGVLAATVLLSFLLTLIMGLYADLPFAVAPGMGINAFFTFTLILGKQIPWPTALGMVFWAGVLFLILSLAPIRVAIAQAIPRSLRIAAAAGIGLFLTFIGFKNAGLIVADPATLVKLGPIDHKVLFSLFGLFLSLFFISRKNPFAFLIGIFAVTFLSLFYGDIRLPEHYWSEPDFESVFLKLDLWGALKLSLLPSILSILFTDLFDSISTFIGVSQATGLLDPKGQPRNLKQGLIVDALATLFAGLFGTSSGTAYIESSAGVEAGAKTGRASVVTAFCFLPFLFIGPLAQMIPSHATAPVLILVGALMFRSIEEIRFKELEDVVPAFLTISLIPLTFSITQGILWGFISHTFLYTIAGRSKEVSRMMYAIAVSSVMLLLMEHGVWN